MVVLAARGASVEERVTSLFIASDRRGPGRVGFELEVVTRDPMPVAGLAHECPSGVRLSHEPGGQLEFSTAPRSTLARLDRDLVEIFALLESAQDRFGTTFAVTGVNPWRTLTTAGLQLRTPRYLAMQEHFDRHGTHGRQMMLLTASLQVNVDLRPDATQDQWELAHLLGPVLTSVFGSEPRRAGAVANPRLAIWLGIDPSRTGFDDRHLRWGDAVAAYAEFARRAAVIIPSCPPELREAPFEEWCWAPGAGPSVDDLECHLTTLFPPVRPRGGYLELRYLDALPVDVARVAIPVVTTLLLDPVTRRRAVRLLRCLRSGLGGWWHRAAEAGIADETLGGLAGDVLELAASGMGNLPPGYLPRDSRARVRAFLAARQHDGMRSSRIRVTDR